MKIDKKIIESYNFDCEVFVSRKTRIDEIEEIQTSLEVLKDCAFYEKKSNIRFHQAASFFEENALEINDILTKISAKQMSSIVSEIINYIDTNYSDENLSLQYLAKKYYVNASYLGKNVEGKNGISFNFKKTLHLT